jgi:hypothetical protein
MHLSPGFGCLTSQQQGKQALQGHMGALHFGQSEILLSGISTSLPQTPHVSMV